MQASADNTSENQTVHFIYDCADTSTEALEAAKQQSTDCPHPDAVLRCKNGKAYWMLANTFLYYQGQGDHLPKWKIAEINRTIRQYNSDTAPLTFVKFK
jgi:hypothetical protein